MKVSISFRFSLPCLLGKFSAVPEPQSFHLQNGKSNCASSAQLSSAASSLPQSCYSRNRSSWTTSPIDMLSASPHPVCLDSISCAVPTSSVPFLFIIRYILILGMRLAYFLGTAIPLLLARSSTLCHCLSMVSWSLFTFPALNIP